MEQYKVEITKEALQDMEDIYNYIALELLSPENAMGVFCKYFLHKVAKSFCRLLHLHFVGNCKTPASPV